MAEFQEVMQQWGRLCIQHCAENHDDCDGCLLGGTRADVCSSYAKDNAEFVTELERLVMEWAAEHPEPIYPTWFEVLERFGVAGRINGEPYYDSMDREIYLKQPAFTPKAFDPIPADIAEKLGIDPKEGA